MSISHTEYQAMIQRKPSLRADPIPEIDEVGLTSWAHSTKAVIRITTDEKKLNRWEKEFLGRLKLQVLAGEILWIGVQNITVKLADDTRYTTDFFAIAHDGTVIAYEVKGFKRDDAIVKLKCAARQFPWIFFKLAERIKGEWKITEMKV